jgi:hypothetical protein
MADSGPNWGFLPIPAKNPNSGVGKHLTCFVSKRLQFTGGKGLTKNLSFRPEGMSL